MKVYDPIVIPVVVTVGLLLIFAMIWFKKV
jgi:hypothetical protein